MSEVVVVSGHTYEKLEERFTVATKWLAEEMGFDDQMIKMVPKDDRWEYWKADINDKHYAVCETTFREAHPLFKQMIWQSHLDEFLQDSQLALDDEIQFILRQSGPGWVRWYIITGGNEPKATYYLVTIFEDPMQAFTFKLST